MHQMEEAVPPSQAKKMYRDVHKRSHAVAYRFRLAVFFRHIKGPEHNQWTPNNIFFGHKAPIAAVQAVIAIVAHGKVVVRRNHHLVIMNVFLQSGGPLRRNLSNAITQGRWKFIAICVVSSVANYIRLGLPDSIQIDHSIAQAKPVAWYANNAFNQIHSLLGRIRGKKDRCVSAVNSAIWQDPTQLATAQRSKSINKYMVAYQ